MSAAADSTMDLHNRARAIAELVAQLRPTAAVHQRVCELTAHIVAANGAGLERLVALCDDPALLAADPAIGEVRWVHQGLDVSDDDIDRYGNRIEALLAAIEQSATPELAAVATRLTTEVSELYGETLERAFTLLHDADRGEAIRAALDDDLIASLLVVHGLHPLSIENRVRACLAELREELPEHGGLVEFVEVDADDTVRVKITGGSEIHRWRTRLAVERAIDRAAPDHGGIDVQGARNEPPPTELTTYIPVDSIRRAAPRRTPRRWIEVPQLSALAEERVDRFEADGVALVACNIGGDLYVAVDPFAADRRNGVRLVAVTPPTIEDVEGTRLVFENPLPVHVTDGIVEVMVP